MDAKSYSIISKRVDNIKGDLVKFTKELIRIPSITGDERAVAEATLRKLQQMGVDDAWIDEIGNVIGILKGGGDGPNILLNSHLDEVPAGRRENWPYEPFGAEMDQKGNIYGRGAVDTKGGLACQLYAMKILKDIRDEKGVSLPGDIIFSSVVYEEAAECFGMQYLCEKSLPRRGVSFDVCYLAEPSHGVVALGHRGKVELVVTTRGETAHSSTPWVGVNALQLMMPILDYVFNVLPENLGAHPQLGKASVTVTNLICRPGGLSIVPDEAEISIDRRYLPGETLDSILDEFGVFFEQLRAKNPLFDASIEVRTVLETSYTGIQQECQKHHPVWVMSEEHPFVQKTINALKSLGQPGDTGYWRFGTDGSWTAGVLGIPTIGFQWGEEDLAHTPTEHITIQQLFYTTEGYTAILCELFDLSGEL